MPEFSQTDCGQLNAGGIRTRRGFEKKTVDSPCVTIVTVVYNNVNHLEETILSVFNQTYNNIEYIIIDGGSIDGSVDIIRKYDYAIDYWISEKDNGIYDAMNKGIELATGEWINFMNSGDLFFNSSVLDEVPFRKHSHAAIIYGNKIQNGRVICPTDVNKLEVGEIFACHQSMFFNLSMPFRISVYYDLNYVIYADFELVNRLYMGGYKFEYVDKVISCFQGGGISSCISYQKRKDKYSILFKCYGLRGILKGLWYRAIK